MDIAHAQFANNDGDMLSRKAQKRSPHSTSNWFTEFCKSLCLSQFTASFINDWAKESIAEDASSFKKQKHISSREMKQQHITQEAMFLANCCPAVSKLTFNRQDAQQTSKIHNQASHANDPSAGSPTETLLRLLLPLNDKVRKTFLHQNRKPTWWKSEWLTWAFNR